MRFRARAFLGYAFLVTAPLLAPPMARADAPAASGSQPARVSAAKAKLAEVRAKIAAIAKQQQATAAQRQGINAKLATQATALDAAAQAVHATDAAIAAQNQRLAQLQEQRAQLQHGLDRQRAALAELLRAVYTLGRGSDLALLLGDSDIARIDRALGWSHYFQRDRVAKIHALLAAVRQLDQVQASIVSATAALQAERTRQAAQQAQLEQARKSQQALLAAANAQLAQQQDKLAQLKRDATALDQLLKQLQNVFSDIPPELGKGTPFEQLRGKLAWPVAGNARAGAGALAQGLVIAARAGSDVHAVAYGRVAYASFMRGFGMLVILDHGNGWMSLYGGNEAALVQSGEWVHAGQAIATVARDSEQGGAFFGLRHNGQPVDPHGWLRAHRPTARLMPELSPTP